MTYERNDCKNKIKNNEFKNKNVNKSKKKMSAWISFEKKESFKI